MATLMVLIDRSSKKSALWPVWTPCNSTFKNTKTNQPGYFIGHFRQDNDCRSACLLIQTWNNLPYTLVQALYCIFTYFTSSHNNSTRCEIFEMLRPLISRFKLYLDPKQNHTAQLLWTIVTQSLLETDTVVCVKTERLYKSVYMNITWISLGYWNNYTQ